MIRWSLGEALRGWGFEPIETETVSAALAAFESEPPSAVLLDINLPDGSGLDVLRKIRQRQQDAVVIMITANVLVDETIAALRGGAYDFIGKPINLEELQVAIRNGIEAGRLRKEVNLFRRERAQQFSFDQIIGESPAMGEMLALAHKVAESEVSSVLLQGESGTGKDLVAKAIHYHSARADNPFVAINCAALPGTLIESELFGYEKGAFTDAKARKEGLFEQAEGGTLFLDEIGELELSLQAKLLRVLEEGAFRRVGGLKDLPLDVRVIAASNRDLKTEGEAGRFRSDLFYRLSVIQIDIPPLRERGDDIRVLAEHYMSNFRSRLRKNVGSIDPEAYKAELILLHCDLTEDGPTENHDEAAQTIRQALEIHSGVNGLDALDWKSLVIKCEDAGETITREAATHGVDLIVMRSRRRPHRAALLGSTAESVSRTAPCPVLVMHTDERGWVSGSDTKIELRRVLVAYDFSDYSELALNYALSFAQEYQSELHLLHVLPPFTLNESEISWCLLGRERTYHKAAYRLHKSVPPEAHLWCDIKNAVSEGQPYREILNYAEKNQIDLICLGAHGAGFGMRTLFGSNVDRVLRQAPCPVLVTRPLKPAMSCRRETEAQVAAVTL